MLELAYKPDASAALARMEAWWDCAILDRPAVQITAPLPSPASGRGVGGEPLLPSPASGRGVANEALLPSPASGRGVGGEGDLASRWLNVEQVVHRAADRIASTYWAGDILPQFWPNLGPEILTAAYGAPLTFGEDTSWSVPILRDWADLPMLRFDPSNRYVLAVLEMTGLSLEMGRGRFITGITDLHPGADLAASLRDPQQLCLDVATEPERVKELMAHLRPSFYQFFDLQYELLRQAGQTVTSSWLPVFTNGRCYIPSADFACMVSREAFNDLFLDEIKEEVQWLDRSIFHLDGPGALRHLDTLLEIEKLNGVQFVCGSAAEPSCRWMDVFRRIQTAGKCLHVSVTPAEVDVFMDSLDPEGVMLCMTARSPEEADTIVRRVTRWTRRGRR